MKRLLFLLFSFCFLSTNQLSALSVSANSTTLNCGTNNITFTFDCGFSGSVLINGTTTGVSFPGLSGPPFIETVTNGVIDIDIDIAASAPTSFTVSFIVLSSNLGCANNNDSASEGFTTNCVLPVNDNCATATALTISTNSCTLQTFSTTNGTTAMSNPSCGGGGYHDLWYSFIANNTTVTFEYGDVPGTVGYYGLYGSCGGAELACSIIIPATGTFSFDLTSLSVGSEYFLQVLYLPGNSGSDQTVCLHSTTVQSSCPTNVVVSDAGPNYPNQSYDSGDIIETNGACNVNGGNIIFTAEQSIEFQMGFDSGIGDFEAVIGVCVP